RAARVRHNRRVHHIIWGALDDAVSRVDHSRRWARPRPTYAEVSSERRFVLGGVLFPSYIPSFITRTAVDGGLAVAPEARLADANFCDSAARCVDSGTPPPGSSESISTWPGTPIAPAACWAMTFGSAAGPPSR